MKLGLACGFFVAMWVACVSCPYAAGLNDPPARTNASEIRRGADIAEECLTRSKVIFLEFNKCVSGELLIQERQASLTEAFQLGLYFNAVELGEISLKVGGRPFEKSRLVDDLIRSTFRFYVAEIDDFEKSLGLTDAQVADLLGLNEKGVQVVLSARRR